MTLHLEPSNDRADWVAFHVSCPACGDALAPLGVGNTTGLTSWLPVKCRRPACRQSWAIKAQVVAVTDQSQAQYLGGVA